MTVPDPLTVKAVTLATESTTLAAEGTTTAVAKEVGAELAAADEVLAAYEGSGQFGALGGSGETVANILGVDLEAIGKTISECPPPETSDSVATATESARPERVGTVEPTSSISVETGQLESQPIPGHTEGGETVAIYDSQGEVGARVSPEEAAHYENCGLESAEVGGKECLVRSDIDWDAKDQYGQTNLERAKQGLAPLDPEGRPYELHHVQQKPDGMLAELTREEHRGVGIDGVLHDSGQTSEIDRGAFNGERAAHWKARAEQVEEGTA